LFVGFFTVYYPLLLSLLLIFALITSIPIFLG
jgi:hypothetical protein